MPLKKELESSREDNLYWSVIDNNSSKNPMQNFIVKSKSLYLSLCDRTRAAGNCIFIVMARKKKEGVTGDSKQMLLVTFMHLTSLDYFGMQAIFMPY